MGSETFFCPPPSAQASSPFVQPFETCGRQLPNTPRLGFLFHSRSVGRPGRRTKANLIRTNVFPGIRPLPEAPGCVPELRLFRPNPMKP